jgi:predicted MPP superfamily phosphohydrolase
VTRRRFFAWTGGALASVAAVDSLAIEPEWVEFTFHDIQAGGPRPVRFVQISDLHLNGVGSLERGIAARVRELEPEFIAITGDSVDHRGRLQDLDDFLALLPRDSRKYAIVGNWEHWAHVDLKLLAGVYERWNGRLLVNRSTVHEVAGTEILITGLDDLAAGKPSIEASLKNVEPRNHHIILAHCPLHRDDFLNYHRVQETRQWRITPPVEMERYNPALMLSGHTHGGQVNLFGLIPFLPEGSGDYVKGWFTNGRPHLYVSRGIGTTILPVRLGSRPEVAVFTMYM